MPDVGHICTHFPCPCCHGDDRGLSLHRPLSRERIGRQETEQRELGLRTLTRRTGIPGLEAELLSTDISNDSNKDTGCSDTTTFEIGESSTPKCEGLTHRSKEGDQGCLGITTFEIGESSTPNCGGLTHRSKEDEPLTSACPSSLVENSERNAEMSSSEPLWWKSFLESLQDPSPDHFDFPELQE